MINEEYLRYLDKLRNSGETNMFGAGVFLKRRFILDDKTAREVLGYWMNTFSKRHPEAARERQQRR